MPLIIDSGNYYLDGSGSRIPFEGIGLLNGRGGMLNPDDPPYYIEWSMASLRAGTAHNSAGEPFTQTEANIIRWKGEV